ncbi:MAG: class I SAM-dependent methyltransferase [Gammaproteobacteria bacterium]
MTDVRRGPSGNLYDKYHSSNPITRHLMRGFMETFDELVSLTGAHSAFEVGCGEGHLSLRLLKRGLTVSGCDLDGKMADVAKAQALTAGYQCDFFASSIYDLTHEKANAEIIVCCEVMEHLPDRDLALAVLAQLAQPFVLFSVPREPIWRILNLARLRYVADMGNTPGHIQHWSTGQFLRLITRHFDVQMVRTPLPWTFALCRRRD